MCLLAPALHCEAASPSAAPESCSATTCTIRDIFDSNWPRLTNIVESASYSRCAAWLTGGPDRASHVLPLTGRSLAAVAQDGCPTGTAVRLPLAHPQRFAHGPSGAASCPQSPAASAPFRDNAFQPTSSTMHGLYRILLCIGVKTACNEPCISSTCAATVLIVQGRSSPDAAASAACASAGWA